MIQRNVWSCEELSCWKSSLVLSHTCPYIHSQLYKRQSSTSESPTVWLCWSSFSCIVFSFYFNHSWNHLRADYWGWLFLSCGTSSKDNCFVKNLLSFELSFSCLFQYFLCLRLSCSWCWLWLSSLLSVKEALDVHLGSITNAISNIPRLAWYFLNLEAKYKYICCILVECSEFSKDHISFINKSSDRLATKTT